MFPNTYNTSVDDKRRESYLHPLNLSAPIQAHVVLTPSKRYLEAHQGVYIPCTSIWESACVHVTVCVCVCVRWEKEGESEREWESVGREPKAMWLTTDCHICLRSPHRLLLHADYITHSLLTHHHTGPQFHICTLVLCGERKKERVRESVGECRKRAKRNVTHYSTLQTVTSALEAHTACYCMLTTSPTLYSPCPMSHVPCHTQAHNSIYVHIYMQWNSPLIQYTSKNKHTHIVFMEAIYGAYNPITKGPTLCKPH